MQTVGSRIEAAKAQVSTYIARPPYNHSEHATFCRLLIWTVRTRRKDDDDDGN